MSLTEKLKEYEALQEAATGHPCLIVNPLPTKAAKYYTSTPEILAIARELHALLVKAEGALRFYGAEGSWRAPMGLPPAREDAGEQARETLAELHAAGIGEG